MAFSSPSKADGAKIVEEQEREVSVKRLKDGEILVVSNRLAQELLMRNPVEFAKVEPEVAVESEVVTPKKAKKNESETAQEGV